MKDTKHTTEYLKKLGDARLSEAARTRIAAELRAYAEFHPVRVGEDGRSIEQVPQRTSLLTRFKQPKSMTAAFIAIALMVGGGTSFAAEGAVPGDFLYPVKTEVNENIKSAFAISDAAEARLQTRLAEERLAEAEALATRGELSAEAAASVSARLKEHYDEVEARSTRVQAAGDFESSAMVRAALEGSLRSYVDVLTDLDANVSGNNGTTLISDIRTYADSTAAAQTQATATVETSADVKAATMNLITQAERVLVDTEATVSRAGSDLSTEAAARVAIRLEEAQTLYAEAESSFSAEAYTAAYTAAQRSLRVASEVQAMITSLLRIEADTGLDTDGVLDIEVDTSADQNNESDTTIRTENEDRTESTTDTDSTSSDTEIESDTTVDTEILDVDVETNTSVRSGLNL